MLTHFVLRIVFSLSYAYATIIYEACLCNKLVRYKNKNENTKMEDEACQHGDSGCILGVCLMKRQLKQ